MSTEHENQELRISLRYAQAVQVEIGVTRTELIAARVQIEFLQAQITELVDVRTQDQELIAGLRERVGRAEAAGREVAEQLRVARRGAKGVVGETLAGEVDGVNRKFRTGSAVRPGSMALCTPHTQLLEGQEGDFVVSGQDVTFKVAPPTGSRLTANYSRARKRI